MMSLRKEFGHCLSIQPDFSLRLPLFISGVWEGVDRVEKEWHGTYVDLLLQIRENDPFD